jgi:hypothetical protein
VSVTWSWAAAPPRTIVVEPLSDAAGVVVMGTLVELVAVAEQALSVAVTDKLAVPEDAAVNVIESPVVDEEIVPPEIAHVCVMPASAARHRTPCPCTHDNRDAVPCRAHSVRHRPRVQPCASCQQTGFAEV